MLKGKEITDAQKTLVDLVHRSIPETILGLLDNPNTDQCLSLRVPERGVDITYHVNSDTIELTSPKKRLEFNASAFPGTATLIRARVQSLRGFDSIDNIEHFVDLLGQKIPDNNEEPLTRNPPQANRHTTVTHED